MSEHGDAYAAARRRIAALARSLTDEQAARSVPACPEWSVRDLLAHLVGEVEDIVTGNVFGVGQPEWTSAQIEARKELTIDSLLAEWDEKAPELEKAFENTHPIVGSLTVGDLVTHEHDLRGALGDDGERSSSEITTALQTYVRLFGRRIKDAGLPAVEVRAGSGTYTAGAGDPAVTLSGGDFELLRALTGRRTRAEVAALDWDGDPGPYTDIVPMYAYPERSLAE